jgi:hypothetical protein
MMSDHVVVDRRYTRTEGRQGFTSNHVNRFLRNRLATVQGSDLLNDRIRSAEPSLPGVVAWPRDRI